MSRIEIRQAVADDADGIARVHVETWRNAYRGIVPDAHLASLDVQKRAQRWREIITETREYVFVAVNQSNEIVGWATGGREKTGDSIHTGELNGIYVHPSAQGQGMGRKLMQTVARRLAADGHDAMLLWVLTDNAPARRFYEMLGGILLPGSLKDFEIGGIRLSEIAYGWPDIRTLESKST